VRSEAVNAPLLSKCARHTGSVLAGIAGLTCPVKKKKGRTMADPPLAFRVDQYPSPPGGYFPLQLSANIGVRIFTDDLPILDDVPRAALGRADRTLRSPQESSAVAGARSLYV